MHTPPKQRLVVVGNGMVGHRFLEELCERSDAGQFEITVFCAEPRLAYDRVHLSSYFSHHTSEELSLVKPGFYERHGIRVLIGEAVKQIDRAAQVVHSNKGTEIEYDTLILATGSYPWVPPITGAQHHECFVYRTIEDLKAIRAAAKQGKSGVVIGGGLLGLEAAYCLHQLGLKVTVLERGTRLLSKQIDARCSQLVAEHFARAGITLRWEGEGVNEDALREFLSVTKAVVDAQQISAEYDPLFGDGEDTASGDDGQHLAVDIPVSMNWYGRAQDPADCAAGNPSDYLLTYIYMVSETGSVPALIRPLPGDVFTPVMTMGVLNTSDQVDAGVAFVGTMLDCETEDLAGRGSFNGYFVRQGVQLAKVSQRYDGTDGNPTPSELNLDAVMAQLTTPSNTDLSLRELVYENAAQLYTGAQDLETTVANILQRTDLYYAEQQ